MVRSFRRCSPKANGKLKAWRKIFHLIGQSFLKMVNTDVLAIKKVSLGLH